MRKKKNHYVSRFYLQGFTDDKGFVSVYDIKRKACYLAKPENIGFENAYHHYIDPEGNEDTTFIEDHLCKIEEGIPAVNAKISNSEQLTGTELDYLFCFMAINYVRVPRYKSHVKDQLFETMRNIRIQFLNNEYAFNNMLAKHTESEKDFLVKFKEDYLAGKVFEEPTNIVIVAFMYIELPLVVNILKNRCWSFIHVNAPNKFFITSDNPICVDHNKVNNIDNLDKSKLIFPVSKNTVAVSLGLVGPKYTYQVCDDDTIIDGINTLIYASAHNFIYTNLTEKETKTFIKKHKK